MPGRSLANSQRLEPAVSQYQPMFPRAFEGQRHVSTPAGFSAPRCVSATCGRSATQPMRGAFRRIDRSPLFDSPRPFAFHGRLRQSCTRLDYSMPKAVALLHQ
jgi:hypothetical protein